MGFFTNKLWWSNKSTEDLVCKPSQPTPTPEPEKPQPKPLMDLTKIKFVKSPNFAKRNDEVRCIVLHHTGSTGFSGTVSWLCDKAASASAHYVVDFDGTINQLVKLEDTSWNVGKSEWTIDGKKIVGLNNCSIGIEIMNIGILEKGVDGKFYYEDGRNLKEWKGTTPVPAKITYPDGKVVEGYSAPYPEKQIQAVIDLCRALVIKYPSISREDILTHYQTSIPLGRKNDPFGLDVDSLISKIFQE
jgi:N-acetyl-anhydromuramyl-L-alanine amidase AmpD